MTEDMRKVLLYEYEQLLCKCKAISDSGDLLKDLKLDGKFHKEIVNEHGNERNHPDTSAYIMLSCYCKIYAEILEQINNIKKYLEGGDRIEREK